MEGSADKTSGVSAPAQGFQALLDRILDPSAPLPLKMSAARGILPLPPGQVLRVLVALLSERQPGIADVATQSLEERTVDLARLAEILQEKTTDPAVLAYFGKRMAGTSEMEILRIVIADPKTPEDTLKMLAATEGGKVLEAILLNEDRLIQTPVLLDVLKSNPEISIRQKTRVDEIEMHLIPGNIPAATPEATPPPVVPVPEVQEPESSDEPAPLEGPAETLPQDLAADPAEMVAAAEREEEEEEEEELPRQALDKIQGLGVPEKIQLALAATREERMILIRDTNRQVSSSVLKSPKVTEKDIESFATMRNVSEDVLRIIGQKRSWLKSYPVTHALVQNPRTPSGIAMGLLSRINTKDMKTLAGNRNIPEAIRRSAQKFWQARTQAPKRIGSKK